MAKIIFLNIVYSKLNFFKHMLLAVRAERTERLMELARTDPSHFVRRSATKVLCRHCEPVIAKEAASVFRANTDPKIRWDPLAAFLASKFTGIPEKYFICIFLPFQNLLFKTHWLFTNKNLKKFQNKKHADKIDHFKMLAVEPLIYPFLYTSWKIGFFQNCSILLKKV